MMRQWMQAGVVLLLLGMGSAARAQEAPEGPADKPQGETSWLANLFGGKPKPEPKKAEPSVTRPSSQDRAQEHDRQLNAYMRRLAVCDRLRDIGRETNNANLMEEADRLEEMAWKVYEKHSSRILGLPPGGNSLGGDDERSLTTLQAGSPGGGAATGKGVNGSGRGAGTESRAAGREGQR